MPPPRKQPISFPTVWAPWHFQRRDEWNQGVREHVQNTAHVMKSSLNALVFGTGKQDETKILLLFFFLKEILNWLFLPFWILTCFNIRIDVNDVQRRPEKGVCGKSYLPSLDWRVIRKENNIKALDLLMLPCKNGNYVVTPELVQGF